MTFVIIQATLRNIVKGEPYHYLKISIDVYNYDNSSICEKKQNNVLGR